jgi:predicted short-subunit dehydrogenase-like oxidoreductase (DUF2520 family)
VNDHAPLQDLTFALLGPGRVGESLARWAAAAGARLAAVGLSPSGRGADLARELGAEAVPPGELSSSGQDLLLVAVPDPALAAVAADLARRPQAAVALHTSGSRTAEALAPLRTAGAAVGSLHPLLAFPRPLPATAARGAVFAIDGDDPALALARRLATAWQGVPVEMPPAARPLYHLAASLAAGGVVTLLALAHDVAQRLNLPPEVSQGYRSLTRSALEAATATQDPAKALTGPAARGDAETLLPQLEALAATIPEAEPLIRLLARETLRQSARLGELTAQHHSLLKELGEVPPTQILRSAQDDK